MVATFAKGDTDGAQALNARYFEQIAFQTSEEYPNPMPAKAICRRSRSPGRTMPTADRSGTVRARRAGGAPVVASLPG